MQAKINVISVWYNMQTIGQLGDSFQAPSLANATYRQQFLDTKQNETLFLMFLLLLF